MKRAPEPIIDGWTMVGLLSVAFALGAMVGAALVKV